jgi:hypothetical protein
VVRTSRVLRLVLPSRESAQACTTFNPPFKPSPSLPIVVLFVVPSLLVCNFFCATSARINIR